MTGSTTVINQQLDSRFITVTGSDEVGYTARHAWDRDRHPCWATTRETAILGCRQRMLSDPDSSPPPAQGRRACTLNTALQVVGAALGLAGTFLIGAKSPLGFWLWIGSNAALIWLHLRVRLPVLLLLHVAYLGLSIYGLINWSQ